MAYKYSGEGMGTDSPLSGAPASALTSALTSAGNYSGEEMGTSQAAMLQQYLWELQQRRLYEAALAQDQWDRSTKQFDTPDRAEYEPRQDMWDSRFYSQPPQAPDQQGVRDLVPQQRFTGQRAPGEEPITRESMIASGRREKQERAAARQAARQKQQGDRALALMAMLSGSQVS